MRQARSVRLNNIESMVAIPFEARLTSALYFRHLPLDSEVAGALQRPSSSGEWILWGDTSSSPRLLKRITDRGFGFIATADGAEYFFHQSACTSTPFDSLREGETVTFTLGQGPKGPRAENVTPA